jgi:predicted ATPase
LLKMGQVPAYLRELAHPSSTVAAMGTSCIFRQLLRNRHKAQEQAEAVIALATEQDFPLYRAAGMVIRGWALVKGKRFDDGIAQICDGVANYAATGAEMWTPYFLSLLAEALGWAGQAADGLSRIDDALDRAGRTEARWIETELHRIRGELLLIHSTPDLPEAETCFRRALAIAHDQSGRLWELRAAMSLAQLWRDQGKLSEARSLLAPVYNRFAKSFDMPDLRQAKRLLATLH